MKKITIISNPQNEGLIIERIGQLGLIQLIECENPEFTQLRRVETQIDYQNLYQKFHSSYIELTEILPFPIEPVKPVVTTLKQFSANPDFEVMSRVETLQNIILQVNAINNTLDDARTIQKKMDELSAQAKQFIASNEKKKTKLHAKIEYYTALEPRERECCYAIGEVSNNMFPQIEEYLNVYADTTYKKITISPQKSLLFIYGANRSKWITALFLVFNVTNLTDVLTTVDKDLLSDVQPLPPIIERYSIELKELDENTQQIREHLKNDQLKLAEGNINQIRDSLTDNQKLTLSELAYMDTFLALMSRENIPRLRTDVLIIIQGWILDETIPLFLDEIHDLEAAIDDHLFISFDDPTTNDSNVPTPTAKITPSFLQPAWTLTTLRGRPSAFEVNPHNLNIIVFSIQFALMFGDVGQGAILLLLGIIFTQKYKRGIMSKLGALFIPMGISTVVCGFLYGEIFLLENLIPAILFRPLDNIDVMMKLTLGIAVIEMSIGLTISIINQVRQRHLIEALGEHGLGAILFLVGLFFSGLHFLEVGDIFETFNHWTFLIMLSGLLLATLTPILSAIVHKRVGIETLSDAIGALLLTFVESLSNFFSFLRIAAFVLAHASLALAAHSLSAILGPGGLVIANVIAMTFELMSTAVQSLRLLYYEFMGKFFQGGGSAFHPFLDTDLHHLAS